MSHHIKDEISKRFQNLYEAGNLSAQEIKEVVNDIAAKVIQNFKGDAEAINDIAKEIIIACVTALNERGCALKENIEAVVNGTIDGMSRSNKQVIKRIDMELLKTKYHLEEQKQELAIFVQEALSGAYGAADNFAKETKNIIQEATKEIKLKNIEMLGLMEETLRQSIQTIIDEGKDVEKSVAKITQNTFENALKTEWLSAQRIKVLSETILTIVIETAEVSEKEIQKVTAGAIEGIQQGIISNIEKLKEKLEDSHEKIRIVTETDLKQTLEDLKSIEDTFIAVLSHLSHKVGDTAWDILMLSITEIKSHTSKIKDTSDATADIVIKYLQEKEKEISHSTKLLAKKAVTVAKEEATQLSQKMLKVATGAISGMIDGAKKALKEDV